jgi:hypothetical protein
MTALTKPRRGLLEALVMYGGSLKAEALTIPDRRLATIMQRDGLVALKAPAISSRHTCLGQTLHITDKGREALQI